MKEGPRSGMTLRISLISHVHSREFSLCRFTTSYSYNCSRFSKKKHFYVPSKCTWELDWLNTSCEPALVDKWIICTCCC
jgi:hypothetical protein